MVHKQQECLSFSAGKREGTCLSNTHLASRERGKRGAIEVRSGDEGLFGRKRHVSEKTCGCLCVSWQQREKKQGTLRRKPSPVSAKDTGRFVQPTELSVQVLIEFDKEKEHWNQPLQDWKALHFFYFKQYLSKTTDLQYLQKQLVRPEVLLFVYPHEVNATDFQQTLSKHKTACLQWRWYFHLMQDFPIQIWGKKGIKIFHASHC